MINTGLISLYIKIVMNEEFLWTVFELSARSGYNDDLIRPFPSEHLLKDGTKGIESKLTLNRPWLFDSIF